MAWELIDLDGPGPKMLFPLAWGHIGWALGWLFFIGGMSEILILAVTLGGLILACIPHVFTELWHDPVRERTMLAVGGLIIWLSLDRWGVLLPLIIMTLLFAVHVRAATALASGPHRVGRLHVEPGWSLPEVPQEWTVHRRTWASDILMEHEGLILRGGMEDGRRTLLVARRSSRFSSDTTEADLRTLQRALLGSGSETNTARG